MRKLIATAVLCALAYWVILNRRGSEQPVNVAAVMQQDRAHLNQAIYSPPEVVSNPSQIKLFKDRLALLSKNWRLTNTYTPEYHNISKECVEYLKTSNDLVELIEYLKEKGLDAPFPQLLQEAALEYLQSGSSASAREALVLSVNMGGAKHSLIREWLYQAAKFCSTSELESFSAAIQRPEFARPILLASLIGAAKSDPIAAVSRMVNELGEWLNQPDAKNHLDDLFTYMPANYDLMKLTQSLPPVKARGDFADVMLSRIISDIGSKDPAKAANTVLSDTSCFKPWHIGAAVGPFVRNQPEVGANWIQEIPEGPYFDYAVKTAVPLIMDGYPSQSRQLAEQVSDPVLRAKLINYIVGAEVRVRSR